MKINLLPLQYRPLTQVTLVNLIMLFAGVFLVIGVCIMGGNEFIKYQSLNTTTTQLQEQLKNYQQSLVEFQKFETLKEQIDKKHQEIDKIAVLYQPMPTVIKAIASAVPDNLWLTKFNIATDGKVTIEGQAMLFSLVGDFLNNLNELPIISSSNLKTITTTDVTDYNAVLYKFAFELETRKESNNNAKK
jgi:Tfp pilus assembly protein PilN